MKSLLGNAVLVVAVVVGLVLGLGGLGVVWVGAVGRVEERDAGEVEAVRVVVAAVDDVEVVRSAVARTSAGREGRLAVHLADGAVVGVGRASRDDVARVAAGGERDGLWRAGARGVVELRGGGSRLGCAFWWVVGWWVLVVVIGVVAGVRVGRRRVVPVVDGVAALVDAARDGRVPGGGLAELRALGEAVEAAARRAERVVEREREVIADVSHRLRTPLTALRLDADALGGGVVADRVRRAVTALGHDVDRIIEALRPVVDEEATCDLGEVVAARMEFWAVHAEDQGRGCEVELPYRPTPVPLSADVVGAVVDALLDNVFCHTPARTALSVAVVTHAGWITLVVEDGGPGVADPERALDRGASGGGSTGLGLDIARGAAEATGGTIHVERGRLGGARVRLRFSEANGKPGPSGPRAWRLWPGAH
ncbi:HAMP domain-containing sensor histidine kinase [Actinosynnema sp. NPDC020468]|uniref:sensor histidine kinase n=1 Tax=Actinosynnema sp. NPDC020468 TaxID=3154488 RepID=UPI00340B24F2